MSANETSPPKKKLSPGEQLQRARKAAGVSLEVIAERTLIPMNKLQSLESDNFKVMGGTAHITGYTRSYARVIGFDAQSVIKDIEELLSVEKANADAINAMTAPVAPKNLWIYPALIVILLLILVLWVWFWFGASKNDESVAPQQNAESIANKVEALNENITGAEGDRENNKITINAIDRPEITTDAQEPDVVEKTDDYSQASLLDDQLQTEYSNSDSNQSQQAVAEESEAFVTEVNEGSFDSTISELSDENSPTVDDHLAQLQLVFIEDCWLEITDANGKKLVADLAKAGQTIKVNGVAPFNLLLGDATAATQIIFNDEMVPFAPRPGRRVLRLTVGE